ncbi:MAG: substrate-binding domain-containing protein [Phycisphaeraceae bacterium]|nr:substrate-binding domain-containing protein [Phycisphaeraceae bacterium]
MAKASMRKVALFGLSDSGYDSGVLRGILAYAQDQTDWTFPYLLNEAEGVSALDSAELDGVIAHITNDELADKLKARHLPVVNLARVIGNLDVPTVGPDDEAAGKMAAEFFLARSYETLAFYGSSLGHRYSMLRERGCRNAAVSRGAEFRSFPGDLKLSPDKLRDEVRLRRLLSEWLHDLPKPVGIACVHDRRGRHLAELCREMDIAVPEQIAIIGMDNYERMCLMCRPALSSVEWPCERIGREAASWLDRMFNGENLTERRIKIPPSGIVSRGSTDAVAVSDAPLNEALRYMRQHARDGIRVADVIKAVPISRRDLERRCFAALGRTPLQELHRLRVEHASRLLASSELPLSQVATSSGFRDVNHLSRVFNRHHGQTPAVWRKAQRQAATEAAEV